MIEYQSSEIITLRSMFFSAASFRANGDAITRSPLGELFAALVVVVVCCSVLLAGSSFFVGSFSFFSVFAGGAVCSSADFGFTVVEVAPPSS